MQVIVHVGMQKTGSTSLQQYLYSYREAMEDMGVIYPDFGHRAHWLLSDAFKRPDSKTGNAIRLAHRGATMTLEEFRAELERVLLEAKDDQLVILSNEGLCREPRAGNLLEFIRKVRPDAEVSILAYIRDPLSHFPSSTQQLLKSEGDSTLFPSVWAGQHCVRGFYLVQALGVDLTLRIFSSKALVKGDVIEDFRDFVRGRTGKLLPENEDSKARNSSHSAPACAVLALRDLAPSNPFPFAQRKQLFRHLRIVDKATKPEKLKLPDDFKRAIASNNHRMWNALVDVSDHDEALRETLKIAPADMPAGADEMNSGKWALSNMRQDHLEALLSEIRNNLSKRNAKELSSWIVDAVNATTAVHGVHLDAQAVKRPRGASGAPMDAEEEESMVG